MNAELYVIQDTISDDRKFIGIGKLWHKCTPRPSSSLSVLQSLPGALWAPAKYHLVIQESQGRCSHFLLFFWRKILICMHRTSEDKYVTFLKFHIFFIYLFFLIMELGWVHMNGVLGDKIKYISHFTSSHCL